jgi:hypothetical protein
MPTLSVGKEPHLDALASSTDKEREIPEARPALTQLQWSCWQYQRMRGSCRLRKWTAKLLRSLRGSNNGDSAFRPSGERKRKHFNYSKLHTLLPYLLDVFFRATTHYSSKSRPRGSRCGLSSLLNHLKLSPAIALNHSTDTDFACSDSILQTHI